MTLAETMINMFGGLITVPKRFRAVVAAIVDIVTVISESESDDFS